MPGMSVPQFAALAESIVVLVPHRPSEGVNGSIAMSAGFWARWGMRFGAIEDTFGGEIAATRAGMCRAFDEMVRGTNGKVKFLVMIDNDEIIAPLAPLQLAFWDKPIVSGVVCSPSAHGLVKACFTVKDAVGIARFPTIQYTQKIPARGLLEVHSCGAGLLCIRHDVIATMMEQGIIPFKIPEADRDECFRSGTMRIGEDISFCRQADDLGFKKYVDFSVRAAHIKQIPVLWPEDMIDHDLDPKDWKVDVRDYAHGD